MTSPNKPDFTLPDFEQLLSRFLAGEQLSPQEKKQLGKHVEQLKQQQVTKHNLFDLFDQVPDQDAIMKRLEAHFARVADVVKDWQGDLTKLNDLPLLSTLHTYTKLWSLKDPANQATKPTPPKSPPKPKNTPQNKQAQTPDAILQARNTETKQQQRMRDEVIDKALHLVKFPTKPYMESIQQQVIDILQKHAVLPANASDTLKNKVMDFLWDRVKDQSFSKQPRFKAWIGDYINWKYYNEADFACDAISCESVVASIKNDIGPFFAFPPLEQVIVDEARASKYFHARNSTKASPTNTTSPSSGETKEQRAERIARETMIIQGLDQVKFQGPVFGKLMEGVIKLLQRERILPRKVTSEQERLLKDFLHKKNPNHPFRDQPRFKFWMATNLEMLFKSMAKPIAANAYLKAVEMIRDDIP